MVLTAATKFLLEVCKEFPKSSCIFIPYILYKFIIRKMIMQLWADGETVVWHTLKISMVLQINTKIGEEGAQGEEGA